MTRRLIKTAVILKKLVQGAKNSKSFDKFKIQMHLLPIFCLRST